MKKIIQIFILFNAISLKSQDTNLLSSLLEKSMPLNKYEEIYNLDVVEYFGIEDIKSPLDFKNYSNTSEYKTLYDTLFKLNTTLSNTWFYFSLENMFDENYYNLEKKGFEINFDQFSCPRLWYDILLKPITTKSQNPYLKQPCINSNINLFISVDEEIGSEIEHSYCIVYFFVLINGKEDVVCCFNNDKHKLFKSDIVRVIVANKTNKVIYFDKTYKTKSK